MEVTPSRGDEAKFFGCGEDVAGLGIGVIGVIGFDATEPFCDEDGEDFAKGRGAKAAAWMGPNGNASGRAEQVDPFDGGELFAWDIGGFAIAKEAIEGLAHIVDIAAVDHGLCDMGTPNGLGIACDGFDLGLVEGVSQTCEDLQHAGISGGAIAPVLGEFLEQGLIVEVEPIAEKVEIGRAKAGVELNPRERGNPTRMRGLKELGNACNGVVIGECDGMQFGRNPHRGKCSWGYGAIRGCRMQMKIDHGPRREGDA